MDEINNKSNIKYQISNNLGKIIKDLIGKEVEPQVEVQNDLSKGDYSTNVVMVTFDKIKNKKLNLKSPMELANEIVRLLNTKYQIPNAFRLIEAKQPGFINFWFSKDYINKKINNLINSLKIKKKPESKEETIIEFGDPNPFKEPHIGHLRIFAVGEAIARLNEVLGEKVVRANYQGDVGAHVAKAIWGIQNSEFRIQNFEDKTLHEKVKFLAECYAIGAKAYEENEEKKKQIISINNKIYQKDSEILNIWEKGRKWSLDYFEELYKKLETHYDKYYFESQTAPLGKEIVEQNPKVFEKHDGAFVFRGEKFNLHTRVFVTGEGYATYEGKDLALAVLKDKDFPNAKKSLIITASEQMEYFKVLIKAMEFVNKKIADKTSHLTVGFVNLKEGKMSSRSGNIVPAFWLLEETKKRLKKGFRQVSDAVLEDLAVGAVKWSMLKFSRESSITFSIEESIQIEGNSGPYMQYAYARTQSILTKSSNKSFEASLLGNLETEELALARIICQFEDAVNEAIKALSPNILTNYLFSLAQTFNHFYEKEKVIGSDREKERLVLVNATGQVLKKGLYLLGIASPEKI